MVYSIYPVLKMCSFLLIKISKIVWQMDWVFAINSDLLIPIQPNGVIFRFVIYKFTNIICNLYYMIEKLIHSVIKIVFMLERTRVFATNSDIFIHKSLQFNVVWPYKICSPLNSIRSNMKGLHYLVANCL